MIEFKSAYLTRNKKTIFDNFDLQVRENEKILLQGKSGTGKTTLFKLLLGFETLDKGRVTFNGHRILKENIKKIRQHIFYLSQDIDLKNETIKILLDEIWETNQIKPDPEKFSDLLALLDLNTQILNQNTNKLSGGERQRVGLLICFMLDRTVWLLDEPTSALEETMKKKIADYILHQNKTIVVISHDTVWKQHPAINNRIRQWA